MKFSKTAKFTLISAALALVQTFAGCKESGTGIQITIGTEPSGGVGPSTGEPAPVTQPPQATQPSQPNLPTEQQEVTGQATKAEIIACIEKFSLLGCGFSDRQMALVKKNAKECLELESTSGKSKVGLVTFKGHGEVIALDIDNNQEGSTVEGRNRLRATTGLGCQADLVRLGFGDVKKMVTQKNIAYFLASGSLYSGKFGSHGALMIERVDLWSTVTGIEPYKTTGVTLHFADGGLKNFANRASLIAEGTTFTIIDHEQFVGSPFKFLTNE